MSLKCDICLKSSTDSFTLRRCQHVFCHKCLHDHIRDNLSVRIKCPNRMCTQNIPDQIIRKCLSNHQTKFYEIMSIQAASKACRKCLTKDCPEYQMVEDDSVKFMCRYCEQPNCLKCQKRHYSIDCGKQDINESRIEYAAKEAIKLRKSEELEELLKTDDYIEYSESFECSLCYEFILPRRGIILRECFHSFCKICFEEYVKNIGIVDKLTCPERSCKLSVDDREVINAIGHGKMKDLICKRNAPKFFSCKFPDCDGIWEIVDSTRTFQCPNCEHENCHECEDIHEGISCSEFRQTRKYKDAIKMSENPGNYETFTCCCGRLIVLQPNRCGAITCDNCNKKLCKFTGKLAGNRGPDSCRCTSDKPCDPKCLYGCIPE